MVGYWRGADLHVAQLMPLPLTVSCFSKVQIGFTFLVLPHLGSPGQRAVKRTCVRVCVCVISSSSGCQQAAASDEVDCSISSDVVSSQVQLCHGVCANAD